MRTFCFVNFVYICAKTKISQAGCPQKFELLSAIVEKKALEISKGKLVYYHQKDFRQVFAIHDEFWFQFSIHRGSVADPNPDPLDPHVFGPSGSGSGSNS
jgi:hypothetical protein